MRVFELTLTTASGRIECARCTARSKRTGNQCKKPALKKSRPQQCQIHGGGRCGPRTAEGKARSAEANLRTGEHIKTELDKADRSRALLRVLEAEAQLLGMAPVHTPRTGGRSPRLCQPVHSPADVLQAILALLAKTSSAEGCSPAVWKTKKRTPTTGNFWAAQAKLEILFHDTDNPNQFHMLPYWSARRIHGNY
jgi:hypothetical protein